MPIVIKHPIFGKREFNIKVNEETICSKCIHRQVCKIAYEDFCKNYSFGTSEYSGCAGCLHKHTRFDKKNPIMCFSCKYFNKIN